MIVLPLVTNALDPDAGFAASMSILVVFGMFSGLAQGSVFGLGGVLPNKYMGAIMFGQGFSGVVISVIRAFCLIGFPSGDPENDFKGALIYFSLAALILVACSIGHIVFQRMPFVIYYIRKANEQKDKTFRRISLGAENEIEEGDSPLLGNDHINTKHEDTSNNT
jgi:solute carrier family 29 (equilibrative nucleoside transporter) protein 4